MKKIVPLLMLLSLLSCNKKQEVNKINKSQIVLIFKNPNIKDTLFYDKNSYAIFENQITYRLNNSFIDKKIDISNKDKSIIIETSEPIYLKHQYYYKDHFFNYYYFEPNDTVIFNYKNGIPFVKCINKNYNYNYASNFNLKKILNTDSMLFYKINKRFKNKLEMKADSLLIIKRGYDQIKYYDSLLDKKLVNNTDYKINTSFVKNQIDLSKNSPIDILKKKYNLSIYGNTFLIENAFNKLHKPTLINSVYGKNIDFKIQFDNVLLLKSINNENRDYLMFSNLENIVKFFSKSEFFKYFNSFKINVQNKSLIKYFEIKYPLIFDDNSIKSEDVFLWDSKKTKCTLKELISLNKGKVVYIDFWASWCTPCREEMPFLKKIQNDYKNREIAFISISIDNDLEKWKIASEKEDLFNNNFLALNYPYASFFKKLQLKTIPRYLIIDKKGKLVHRNAPNPQGKEIRVELDKFLSQ